MASVPVDASVEKEEFVVKFEEGLLKLEIDDDCGLIVTVVEGIPDVVVGDLVTGCGAKTFPVVAEKEALSQAVRDAIAANEAVSFNFLRTELVEENGVTRRRISTHQSMSTVSIKGGRISKAIQGGGVGMSEDGSSKSKSPPSKSPREVKMSEPDENIADEQVAKEEPKQAAAPTPGQTPDAIVSIPPTPKSEGSKMLLSQSSQSKDLRGAITHKDEDHKAVVQKLADKDEDMKRMLKVASRIAGSEVTKGKILDYLATEARNNHACLEFPFVILFFIAFATMILVHENIVDTSQVERNYRNFFSGTGFEGLKVNPAWPVSGHKDIDDIDLVADIWTYLEDAIMPLFLNSNSSLKNDDFGKQTDQIYRVIRYNQLIGGFQMRQTRREKKNCVEEHPDLGPFNTEGTNPFLKDFECFPISSIAGECFGPGLQVEGFCPISQTPYARRLRVAEREQTTLRHIHRRTSDSYAAVKELVRMTGLLSGRRLSTPKHAARSRLGVGKQQKLRLDPFEQKVWENTFVATFFSHEGLDEALRRLNVMKGLTWIDEQSSLLEVACIVFNPDLQVYTQAMVSLYLVPDGGIVPYVQTTSFNAEPYRSMVVIFFDFFWLLCWLQLSITFFIRLCKTKGPRKSFFDVFMWFDAGCFVGGFIIIIFWLVYLGLLDDTKKAFVEEALARPKQFGGADYAAVMDTYQKKVIQAHEQTAELVNWAELFRVGTCWFTLFTTMRFFKAFASQPKLAVVTNTLANCFVDFVHFFIVFWTMFMSYVLAAMFLFGHRIAEFSSTEMAISKCFLLLLGDFDFDELMEENPVTAGLWFYTFCIFMTQIILNMMLAIIMDTYSAVQGAAAESDKLWEQMWQVFYEFIMRDKNHIPAAQLLIALEKLPDEMEYIGVPDLKKACPDMTEDQAKAILEKVEKYEEADDEASLGMADAMKLIVSIRMNVLDIDKTLLEYVKCEKETRDLLLGAGKPLRKRSASDNADERPGATRLHPDSARKMSAVEKRLDVIETFLNEAMCYLVFRGKELRNRLQGIEERLSGQRDQAFIANQDMWDNPPNLGGRAPNQSRGQVQGVIPVVASPADSRMLPIAFTA